MTLFTEWAEPCSCAWGDTERKFSSHHNSPVDQWVCLGEATVSGRCSALDRWWCFWMVFSHLSPMDQSSRCMFVPVVTSGLVCTYIHLLHYSTCYIQSWNEMLNVKLTLSRINEVKPWHFPLSLILMNCTAWCVLATSLTRKRKTWSDLCAWYFSNKFWFAWKTTSLKKMAISPKNTLVYALWFQRW